MSRQKKQPRQKEPNTWAICSDCGDELGLDPFDGVGGTVAREKDMCDGCDAESGLIMYYPSELYAVDELVNELVAGGMERADAEAEAEEIRVVGIEHRNVSDEARAILYRSI